MSLQIDGIWKGAVWASTPWAANVWYEGGPVAPADSPLNYSLAFPAGAILPRFGEFSGDIQSHLAHCHEYLTEVEQWLADSFGGDEEIVNPYETGFETDAKLDGREERWARDK